jgi:hypothetical protein
MDVVEDAGNVKHKAYQGLWALWDGDRGVRLVERRDSFQRGVPGKREDRVQEQASTMGVFEVAEDKEVAASKGASAKH